MPGALPQKTHAAETSRDSQQFDSRRGCLSVRRIQPSQESPVIFVCKIIDSSPKLIGEERLSRHESELSAQLGEFSGAEAAHVRGIVAKQAACGIDTLAQL